MWTEEKPSKDGYYWCKSSHGSVMILEVVDGDLYMPYTGIRFNLEIDFPEALLCHKWYGPILPPA